MTKRMFRFSFVSNERNHRLHDSYSPSFAQATVDDDCDDISPIKQFSSFPSQFIHVKYVVVAGVICSAFRSLGDFFPG